MEPTGFETDDDVVVVDDVSDDESGGNGEARAFVEVTNGAWDVRGIDTFVSSSFSDVVVSCCTASS